MLELSVTGGEGHAAISTRAMSLGLDLYTAIEVVPRSTIANTVFKHDCPACPSLGGTNPFGYVAFQVLGVGTTVDGLNERGLSASWQPFVDGTGESERLDSVTMHAILVPLTAYIMGNYVTADEVRSVFSSQKLTLTHDLAQFEPIPLTVVVHDARGESVVLTLTPAVSTTSPLMPVSASKK
ncbi:TPA: hypothetical protein N0F65_009463 [Lagenidium giganteum]|uniref:Choloylglycine hydrolase/NAAA C-terminal domain-containing protein n=1 Tax=Lagenidium giganteum TaxID=4803 RepID=A0AAV2Z9W9_9STRA|nr:TPA: hypothetical protein N0F65_009463 [Lagenidium giganteum]